MHPTNTKNAKNAHKICKNHTKNAKNDISLLTDILLGLSPIGHPRYYRDIFRESITFLRQTKETTNGLKIQVCHPLVGGIALTEGPRHNQFGGAVWTCVTPRSQSNRYHCTDREEVRIMTCERARSILL